MRVIELQQGSPEWHAHRAKSRNASDAPAMLGFSTYVTRNELLRRMSTGMDKEIDSATQRLFDRGHEIEAFARGIVEKRIGEDLYPVIATDDDGYLSASFDGITMSGNIVWECKTLNDKLKKFVDASDLPDSHWPQCEQQLLISSADKCLFTISDGTEENTFHLSYFSKPERRAQLIAGWKQFDIDLANYVPQEVIPAAVADPVEGFGALVLQVEGRVLACNLESFKVGAQSFIDRLPKSDELKTDQDFANAESAVKACSEAETRIQAALDAAMAQAASIDEVFRAARHISELIRSARLALDKSVKSRKESIRMEIMQDAQAKLAEHVKALNERIGWFNGSPIISPAAADFATAIKGKKTVSSLRDGCDTELARAKIATSEIADRIEANRKAMGDHAALFPDFPHVCTKTAEDFANLVAVRVENERVRLESIKAAEINTRNVINPPTPLPESGAPVAVIQPSPQPVADSGVYRRMTPREQVIEALADLTDIELGKILKSIATLKSKRQPVAA